MGIYGGGMPWKKMAAAFGRAVEDPSATKKGRKMVFDSKTVKDRYGDTQVTGFDTDEQRSFKGGMAQGRETYDITYDQREIPEAAKRVYEAYDLEDARRHGPDAAYQRALARADVDIDEMPSTMGEFKEWFGFDVEDSKMPKHKPGWKKAWDDKAEGYSDMNMKAEGQEMIDRGAQQADYAGRMKGMREGELADDAVDEAISEDYGQQYLDEFKRRLTEGNVADALRWAAEEYEKYSK